MKYLVALVILTCVSLPQAPACDLVERIVIRVVLNHLSLRESRVENRAEATAHRADALANRAAVVASHLAPRSISSSYSYSRTATSSWSQGPVVTIPTPKVVVPETPKKK